MKTQKGLIARLIAKYHIIHMYNICPKCYDTYMYIYITKGRRTYEADIIVDDNNVSEYLYRRE